MASYGDPEPLRAGVSDARRVSDDGRPPEVRQAALRCAGFEASDRHLRQSTSHVSSDYAGDSRCTDRGEEVSRLKGRLQPKLATLQKTLGRVDTHTLQIHAH